MYCTHNEKPPEKYLIVSMLIMYSTCFNPHYPNNNII